jgi:uncharacterized protein YqgV (UPF0045/DUF77 family)
MSRVILAALLSVRTPYDAQVALIGELLVEPFVPGDPGHHVRAAWDAASAAGATLEVGPFGTIVRAATDDDVLNALDAAVRASISAGATRVSTQVLQEP